MGYQRDFLDAYRPNVTWYQKAIFTVQIKKGFSLSTKTLDSIGRDGVIRTLDPLHPMQVRYQAALRPDLMKLYQIEPGRSGYRRHFARCRAEVTNVLF